MLIYAHKITPRLEYVCAFIFRQYFGIDCSLTSDLDLFSISNEEKLNYSLSSTPCRYTIKPADLLFEKTINAQQISCFEDEGYKAFFKTTDSNFPFDIFAAVFYLLSRYEEYLPHTTDQYGRYAHENSIAFKENFLQQPLVNIWLNKFSVSIQRAYPGISIKTQLFSFTPTYDIDIAWSFKNKGLLRDAGAMILKPSSQRWKVLRGKEKDPYDCYGFLNRLHDQFNLNPVYFFLVAASRGRYDKNNDISGVAFKKLIKDHAEKYRIGLHPSWKSNEETELLTPEKRYLELQSEKSITLSRQHYLKYNLPHTLNSLIKAGIKDDYSLGYGTVNGFRASVATSFNWYDLQQESETSLILHPFCFMDATSAFQTKASAHHVYEELLYYFSICKEVNADLITIFHNNILGGTGDFAEWPRMYERFLQVVSQNLSEG